MSIVDDPEDCLECGRNGLPSPRRGNCANWPGCRRWTRCGSR